MSLYRYIFLGVKCSRKLMKTKTPQAFRAITDRELFYMTLATKWVGFAHIHVCNAHAFKIAMQTAISCSAAHSSVCLRNALRHPLHCFTFLDDITLWASESGTHEMRPPMRRRHEQTINEKSTIGLDQKRKPRIWHRPEWDVTRRSWPWPKSRVVCSNVL